MCTRLVRVRTLPTLRRPILQSRPDRPLSRPSPLATCLASCRVTRLVAGCLPTTGVPPELRVKVFALVSRYKVVVIVKTSPPTTLNTNGQPNLLTGFALAFP